MRKILSNEIAIILKKPELFALFFFSLSSVIVYGENQVRILAILTVVIFFMTRWRPNALGENVFVLKSFFPVPPELILYTFWVVWTGVTGVIVSIDMELFYDGMIIIMQMLVVIWIVYGITVDGSIEKKKYKVVFLGIFVGCFIQLIIALVTGGVGVENIAYMDERVTANTSNPNGLGFRMIWLMLSAFILIHKVKNSIPRNIIYTVLIALSIYAILLTGSRKSIVVWVAIVFLWFIYVRVEKRKITLRSVFYVVVIIIVIAFIINNILPMLLDKTYLGQRFYKLMQKGGIISGVEDDIRYAMYIEGLKMFLTNPLTGVGWFQYRAYFWTGQYSHSDYIEPLASTGIVGFILYQSWYFILLLRLFRLIRSEYNLEIKYQLKSMLIVVLSVLLLGFGAPHYGTIPIFLMLVSISSYSWGFRYRIINKPCYL